MTKVVSNIQYLANRRNAQSCTAPTTPKHSLRASTDELQKMKLNL